MDERRIVFLRVSVWSGSDQIDGEVVWVGDCNITGLLDLMQLMWVVEGVGRG